MRRSRRNRHPVVAAVALATGVACGAPALAEDATTMIEPVEVIGHAPPSGPVLSVSGASDYGLTATEIDALPTAGPGALTDVLAQMPGVAIDQNQQIHIRDTEGPQFQYQIDGALVPLDINTNPPFLSMINPMFIQRLDLIDGVLPARYGLATGGVVDIQTKDGCRAPGGEASLLFGQRQVLAPSFQYAGCAGRFGYYLSSLYDEGETAFSQATPGPTPIHDYTRQGQAFGVFTYDVDPTTRLSLVVSGAASDNQLPNVPGLAPQFTLAGAAPLPSADINSYLNFRDALAILSLTAEPTARFTYHLAYAFHAISQDFRPDDAGELIYQGVASRASHRDIDNTLQGDVTYQLGGHTLGAGFYAGAYDVTVSDASLVFPVDAAGAQASTTPIAVASNAHAVNLVLALYANDLWRISDSLRLNFGVRLDELTGFTNHWQIDPTVNLTWDAGDRVSLHAGFARSMQAPSYQGISPGVGAAFAGTTAAALPGVVSPLAEDDYTVDAGAVLRLGRGFTVSEDNYYERTDHYLDTGQFGVVPIFAPFNYDRGHLWGSELAVKYSGGGLTAYANLTVGRNVQTGVATGQFNFDADELAFIDSHYIVLDHQPRYGVSAGLAYDWKGWGLRLDGLYSSGLRGGFADTEQLPPVIQVNAAIERGFRVPGLGRVVNRVTILNAFDRINLIRPAEGIGIFQSAYGPRFTVLDSVSVRF